MEDEFSLGQYVAILRRRWYVIVVALGITLLAALAYNLFLSPGYDAKAVLVAEPPKYLWRLDYNFQSVPEDLRLDRRGDYLVLISEKAPGIALAQRVIDRLGEALPPDMRSPKAMWKLVSAKNGRGRVIYLTASAPSALLAQTLANTWADVLIAEVNARYGQVEDKAKFQAALAQAKDRLAVSSQALETFRARTGLGLSLGGQLTTLKEGSMAAGLTALQQEIVLKSSTLAEYREALDRVRLLKQRAEKAKAQGQDVSGLPLELLDAPLLVQRGRITRDKIQGASGDIAAVVQALGAEEQSLSESIDALQSETDALQADLSAQFEEAARLYRQQTLDEEAVRALERKVSELGIQEGIAASPLVLLGSADKATPMWIVYLLLAAVVGVLGGVLLAYAVDFGLANRKG